MCTDKPNGRIHAAVVGRAKPVITILTANGHGIDCPGYLGRETGVGNRCGRPVVGSLSPHAFFFFRVSMTQGRSKKKEDRRGLTQREEGQTQLQLGGGGGRAMAVREGKVSCVLDQSWTSLGPVLDGNPRPGLEDMPNNIKSDRQVGFQHRVSCRVGCDPDRGLGLGLVPVPFVRQRGCSGGGACETHSRGGGRVEWRGTVWRRRSAAEQEARGTVPNRGWMQVQVGQSSRGYRSALQEA